MKVAVIGGGINGFCCAVQILEHFQKSQNPVEVTVLSDSFTPNTTGDGSAGLWGPYLLGGTSTAKVHKWSKGMHDFLEQLWLSSDAGEAGICLVPVVRLTTGDAPVADFWRDIVYGCAPITPRQLAEFNASRKRNKFTNGLHFVTYTSEPTKLLPYLMKRFQSTGGKIIERKVLDLEDMCHNSDIDVFINCSGLGARELVRDGKVYPVRGQVSRVKANWLYYVLLDESDDGNYIIPNTDSVVLGGTHQDHDYSTAISAQDKKFITRGCEELIPGLEHAPHLFDWVGLRPGRPELRLEVDTEDTNNKIIVHNYGHGGSGVTLAWGCATDVLQLLDGEIAKRTQLKSKL